MLNHINTAADAWGTVFTRLNQVVDVVNSNTVTDVERLKLGYITVTANVDLDDLAATVISIGSNGVVSSVAGRNGDVVLGIPDVVGLQANLDAKVDVSDLGSAAYQNSNYFVLATDFADFEASVLASDGTAADASLFGGHLPSWYQQALANVSSIELANNLGADVNVLIDLHASANVDYSARIMRAAGANGALQIKNSGAGNVEVTAAGLTVNAQPVWTAGNFNPANKLDVNGQAVDSAKLAGQPNSYYTNIPARLGYYPVQQGTGVGQSGNVVKIGWSNTSQVRLTIDSTDYGATWPMSITGDAHSVDGQVFNYSSQGGTPTYVWGTNTNGTAYLFSPPQMSVGYASGSGSVNGQVFNWAGQSGTPTYFWATNSNGNAYLFYPSQVTVGKASTLSNGGGAGSPMTFTWNDPGDQPSYLWGGNDGTNMKVYPPGRLNVNHASTADSATNASNATRWNTAGFVNSSQGGNPPYVLGGSGGTNPNFYMYSPANFSVAYAASAGSAPLGSLGAGDIGAVYVAVSSGSGQGSVPLGGAWRKIGTWSSYPGSDNNPTNTYVLYQRYA